MKKVFDRLEKLEIAPELNNSNDSIENTNREAISNKVIREAHDILRRWDEDNSYDDKLEEQVAIFLII